MSVCRDPFVIILTSFIVSTPGSRDRNRSGQLVKEHRRERCCSIKVYCEKTWRSYESGSDIVTHRKRTNYLCDQRTQLKIACLCYSFICKIPSLRDKFQHKIWHQVFYKTNHAASLITDSSLTHSSLTRNNMVGSIVNYVTLITDWSVITRIGDQSKVLLEP